MKPSKNKLKEWIAEEKASSKMYIKYGHPEIARQERNHARILSRQLKGGKR